MESLLLEDRREFAPQAPEAAHACVPGASEREEASAERLQPLSLAGIFDAAFDLYKRRFVPLALVTAILMLPLLVALQALESLWLHPLAMQTNWSGDDAQIGRAFLILLGYLFTGAPRAVTPGVLSLAALSLVSGAVTLIVADDTTGRTPSARAALRGIRPHLMRLLGGWLVTGLAFFMTLILASFAVTIFLGIGLSIASAASGGLVAEALAYVLLAGLIVLPYLAGTALVARFFLLMTPVLVLERLPVTTAPGRAVHLTGKRLFWRAWLTATFLPLAILLLAFLMLFALDSAVDMLKNIPLIGGVVSQPLIAFVLHLALATAIFLFFQPYWMVCLTLLYFDFRIRREAFDLQVFSADLPPVTPGAWAMAAEGNREQGTGNRAERREEGRGKREEGREKREEMAYPPQTSVFPGAQDENMGREQR
ncbi:MAG TPA: hypothetical protein VKT32_14425 [Chthonomonadaceae bacterium]|nr:hypothetical protein [Chthonomonadaceae bacterium]